MTEQEDTVPFTELAVQAYLDGAITAWRATLAVATEHGDEGAVARAAHYIDAFQSVRSSLFGTTNPGADA